MSLEAVGNAHLTFREAGNGWFQRKRGPIIRHLVINLFMIIILLPLLWVLLMSVKTRPDAMKGVFWPTKFDFTRYQYVFEKIDTLPINLFNSIYVTAGTVLFTSTFAVLAGYALVHLKPRGNGIHYHSCASRFALFPGTRRLDYQRLRDSELPRPYQCHQRPNPSLYHAEPGDQHPYHAQHVSAGAA
jgi:ABC-type Fe3+ transport system permease subunit